MKMALIQILTAGIGALGFSIYFRVNEKNVIASTAGGALGWAMYLLIFAPSKSLFFANFVASLFICLYSELMSRKLKAPSNIYMVPGIIPLLPGGALYYTMSGIVSSNEELFKTNCQNTLEITFGIATGIVVGTVLMHYFSKLQGNKKSKDENKSND